MAHALVENSPRLQVALAALRAHPQGLTALDWCREGRIMNCGEIASELRAQGYDIRTTEEPKRNGRRIFRYRLVEGEWIKCPGDDCSDRVKIVNGKGYCVNHAMEITIRG